MALVQPEFEIDLSSDSADCRNGEPSSGAAVRAKWPAGGTGPGSSPDNTNDNTNGILEAKDGDGEEECDDACCDEEDPFVEPSGDAQENGEVSSAASAQKSPKRQRSRGPMASRLEELARPKPQPTEPEPLSPTPLKRPEKKQVTNRPSLLLRLRPINLEEAWEEFCASGYTVAPRFRYTHSEEYVTKHFQENSNVCFELLGEAKRIIQRVKDEYGGPEAFMQQLYGERKISAEELRDIVAEYLKEHNIEDKVEIRIVENMLSAANVLKPGADEKYVVNITNNPISWNMVQGICDHEVGTHLLRMMNDEHQVWHGIRERYKLANPWTTEEGFATLNTYQSMPCRLMYPQALRYYMVCRGAQTGFVELFDELRSHVSDLRRCWQMCCRIKRGMIDTSLPGAFYMDQAYFKGAVEILRHLDEVDFGRLYGGQIALQDLDKVHFLLRKEVVRLPRFLNSAQTLKAYKTHCRKLIKENQIEAAIEKVCKPVFIRTAREFLCFKPPKKQLNTTIAFGESADTLATRSSSVGATRSHDLERLADLARPRQLALPAEDEAAQPSGTVREVDRARVAELSTPRRRAESEAPITENRSTVGRTLDLARLEDLAKPRQLQPLESDSEGTGGGKASGSAPRRSAVLDRNRLLALAQPKAHVSSTEEEDVPPPPAAFDARPLDLVRLAELALPRKTCEEDKSAPCKCPPKASKRSRRKSKFRILAMKQSRDDLGDGDADLAQASLDAELNMQAEQDAGLAEDSYPASSSSMTDGQAAAVPSDGAQDVEEKSVPKESLGASVSTEGNASLAIDSGGTAHAAVASATALVAATTAAAVKAKPLRPRVSVSAERAGSALGGELHVERKPPGRAVARARSLSSAGEVSASSAGNGGGLPSKLPFEDLDFGGFAARRARVPIGLPRGAVAAVAATASAAGDGCPLWKAVPIKTMQFDF